MSSFSDIVPPGFRFHPTEEELVNYYLRKRVASIQIDLDVIKDVDLYRIEPWDLQELCNMGTEDQNDYYFFSHKDKKYPTGTRTNRATKEGFWKATGRDKAIYVKHRLIGMRKTLVYYKGRAPNGQKLDWIMHEYRLETDHENAPPQEEGWVVCKMFKKRMVISTNNMRKEAGDEYDHHQLDDESASWYIDEQASSFMNDHMDYSPMQMLSSPPYVNDPNNHIYIDPSSYSCKEEDEQEEEERLIGNGFDHYIPPHHQVVVNSSIHDLRHGLDPLQLQGGQLQQTGYYDQQHNMRRPHSSVMKYGSSSSSSNNRFRNNDGNNHQQAADKDHRQMMSSGGGWSVLDRFVASQLSHGISSDHAGDENNYLNYNGAAFESRP